jgi:hypothetical protein
MGNMTKIALAILAAIVLVQPALSDAGAPTNSGAKPSSFVPHSHTNNHVYGSPIQPAIVGHARTSHQRHLQKKRTLSGANRNAH